MKWSTINALYVVHIQQYSYHKPRYCILSRWLLVLFRYWPGKCYIIYILFINERIEDEMTEHLGSSPALDGLHKLSS